MLGLDRTDLIVLGLSFGVPAVLALVFVGVIVAFLRARPEPLSSPDGVFRLQGHLLPASSLLSFSDATFGRVEVTFHELLWLPLAGPPWRVPIPALILQPDRFFGLGAGTVVFELPGTGMWRLRVSDRHINRFVGNDFKTMREGRRADELRNILLARGARMAASAR